MKKRILSILLTIVMAVGILTCVSLTVFASDDIGGALRIGGGQVTSAKLSGVAGVKKPDPWELHLQR